MRIIAGEAGGRKLKTLPGNNTRPTADRVKEAVFSSLSPYIYGSRVLDLFAGSAALGLECLSRGASFVLFCEQNRGAQEICRENIKICNFGNKCQLLTGDSFSVLPMWLEKNYSYQFDLIFLDPPYKSNLLIKAIEFIHDRDLLAKDGMIIAETATGTALSFETLSVIRDKKYGDTRIRFYKLNDQLGEQNGK